MAKTQHGGRHTPEYAAWTRMKRRCYNPKQDHYDRYGGRGIAVCARWLNSFENFLADMGPRPSPKHSIERKDNDRDYEPANCVWATLTEQTRNRCTNKLLTYKGRTQCLAAWAEEIGIGRSTLDRRIRHYKWPIERALTTPVGA